jgi:uncharacterized protein (DUF1697 family)
VTRVVALLRAVNVGGTKAVSMPALCKLLAGLGYTGVKSLLASGNLVFGCSGPANASLEAKLEAAVAKGLGVQTAFFVREAREWDAVVANNPYLDAARDDPSHLVVMAFKSPPAAEDVAALQAGIAGRETVAAVGRHAYLVYPDGIGTSKLTNALIEGKLGLAGTARNWNTVLKLAAAAALLERGK